MPLAIVPLPAIIVGDFLIALAVVSSLSAALFSRRIGISGRLGSFLAALLLAASAAGIAALASSAGALPQAVATAAGASLGFLWSAARAYRRRRRRAGDGERVKILRPVLIPIDYGIGLAFYGAVAVATAYFAAHSNMDPESGLGLVVVLFIWHQIMVSILFRFFNQAFVEDYRARRGWHYLLATVPVLLAVAVDVRYSVSFIGPLFRLALLAAAWRYTIERPTGTVRTLRALSPNRRRASAVLRELS